MSGLTIQEAVNARVKAREELETNSDASIEEEDSQEQTETLDDDQNEESELDTENVDDTATPDEEETDDEESEEESEESEESEENDDEVDDEKELEYYQIGDEEVTLEEIKKWKSEGLMQADYTKKTQELSKEKDFVKSEKDNLLVKESELKDQAAMLSVLIDEDKLTDEEWSDLKTINPAQYLEKKELEEKRVNALEKAKEMFSTTKQLTVEESKQEQTKLLKANPTWLTKDGNLTEIATKELSQAQETLKENNIDANEIQTAEMWQLVINASKYKNMQSNTKKAKKKVLKAPTVTKSRAKSNMNASQKALKEAQKLAKENPTVQNLANLRAKQRAVK